MSEHERRLQNLALNDETALASLLGAQLAPDERTGLSAKTQALVRLGAVVVIGASPVTYQWQPRSPWPPARPMTRSSARSSRWRQSPA